ncbi:uncharacterized protein PHACADRAFT_110804 [Phanerochaete carnosa HHB-10118-sp]|uniref:Ino eighty subunit 1 n=1 Tax=Phanerochaete carnosa (strain HHB-10118-sp) TaxID=650164 RepID=K5VD80_PHACS|nr:uncharacterized protein PHACADRAFT_110804 [Phanerochaete carnosa HHB-10118-sp]EKM60926.1 hypothetical protein PHACADRAFT_110804 [Phanerochaete carnosa HHB-10118-sp]
MASSSSTDPVLTPTRVQSWNPQQVNTPPQYLGRKTLPIKRADGEPLTRADIQYDLLYFIFADPSRVFVDYMAPGKPHVNFCDLYVNALFNSSKCSKVLKDKMVDTPEFAIEFAKIALLTNVGRINTTMAFFHEMKTPLRSYHPVPSLQKSDGNLQDAPRIKNCLKAALLPFEFKTPPPSTPNEIREKARAGQLPPTSVVNLIFVLSNAQHAMQIAQTHFEPPVEFLDLFLPINLSSASRAKAFLWLVYHYLSASDTPNPFDDDYSRANPGKVPRMVSLSREETQRENVDPSDEVDWGKHMSSLRVRFLKELMDESEAEKRRKRDAQMVPPVSSSFSAAMYSGDITSGRPSQTQGAGSSGGEGSRGSSYGHEVQSHPQAIQQPVPRPAATVGPPQAGGSGQEDQSQDRTMLQHAWHVVQTTDPLADSDGEQDEHVRREYGKSHCCHLRRGGTDPLISPPYARRQTPAHLVSSPRQGPDTPARWPGARRAPVSEPVSGS